MSDDAPIDDLLNFVATVPWIGCWMSFLPHKYGLDTGKLDGPVFTTPNVGLAVSVFSHEDIECDFSMKSWLASLILLPSANFWIFGSDHPRHHRLSLFSYDDLLALDRLGLRWPNQDLLPLELDRVHVNLKQIFVELHSGIFNKFQSSFVYDRLNLIIIRIS
jgi:hypothetical protein